MKRPDRGHPRLAWTASLAAALLSSSCGSEVPAGGVKTVNEAPLARRVDPLDLVPADLDLVVRVDLARLRAGLGPVDLGPDSGGSGLPGPLSAEADPLLREAIEKADTVWLAMRATDFDGGDRVIVVSGKLGDVVPSPDEYEPARSMLEGVQLFEHRGVVRRTETAQVIAVEDRALAFVSPVETPSVARVLREGPDEGRGDPRAEGLMSLDYRARRLSPELERKYPSISAVIAGIERIRASATLVDRNVALEAEIIAKTDTAADKALRFLQALRDNLRDPELEALLSGLKLERVDHVVHVEWQLPAELVLRAIRSKPDPAPEPEPSTMPDDEPG